MLSLSDPSCLGNRNAGRFPSPTCSERASQPVPHRRLDRLAGYISPLGQVSLSRIVLHPAVIIKWEKTDREPVIAKELFDTEAQAYERLRDIQGLVAPICYGQVRCNERTALVLQHVGGLSLAEPAGANLDLEELSRRLHQCCQALHAFGVHQSDFMCGNFRLVGSRLMVLDLEMTEFDLPEGDRAFFTATGISHLASAYRRSRAFFRREGWLEVA